MADKDLRKLKRQDLLELLILQSKEVLRMQDDIVLKNSTIDEFQAMADRLKEKLNEKDEQIEHLTNRLKEKLDEKDAQIDRLKEKLDDKDVQLDRLKSRLDQKDAKILRLETHLGVEAQNDDDVDDSSFMLQKIYEAAHNAVGLYMKRAEDGTFDMDHLADMAEDEAKDLIEEEKSDSGEEQDPEEAPKTESEDSGEPAAGTSETA